MSFIDTHCHPSMMMYLADANICNGRISPFILSNLIAGGKKMRTSLPQLVDGQVDTAVSVYYLPERQLIAEANKNFLYLFFQSLIYAIPSGLTLELARLKSKFDSENSDQTFQKLLAMIEMFESKIDQNKVFVYNKKSYNVRIAKTFQQLIEFRKDPLAITFVHSIEGSNGLGNKLDPAMTPDKIMERIKILVDKGVAQWTLGHFFENILVSSSGGIDPNTAKMTNYKLRGPNDEGDPQLKNTYANGYNERVFDQAISYLFDRGVVIDLVHMDPRARKRIYEINKLRVTQGKVLRPILFSHTGVKAVVDQRNTPMWQGDQNSKNILPTDEEILEINGTQGVVGLIFMNYWLCGEDGNNNAFTNLMANINYLRKMAGGNMDFISFGTDLDGLTTAPPDLDSSGKIPTLLVQALLNSTYDDGKPISQEDVDKMTYKNYLRVLSLGWGESQTPFIA